MDLSLSSLISQALGDILAGMDWQASGPGWNRKVLPLGRGVRRLQGDVGAAHVRSKADLSFDALRLAVRCVFLDVVEAEVAEPSVGVLSGVLGLRG